MKEKSIHKIDIVDASIIDASKALMRLEQILWVFKKIHHDNDND